MQNDKEWDETMCNSKEKDEKYKKVVHALNQTICDNLKALLKARDLSQRSFCKKLAEEKTSITRTYLSKILNNPQHISAAFLLSCCDFFGITLQNLASTNFDATEYIYNDTEEHKDYLHIEALLKKQDTIQRNADKLPIKKEVINGSLNSFSDILLPFNDSNLITDPKHTLFAGYLQDYYCYYYPTHSSENIGEDNILKGILKLEPNGNYCKASLKIDTNTIDDEGNINYKTYTGYAAISPSVNSLHCIMYSDSLCEFCFLMFRFFRLNFGKQDCRIAEVLSSSSADEERRPTVLRMFLSKELINDNDLKKIAPTFLLNYSTIAISEEKLQEVGNISKTYKSIVDSLIDNNTSIPMFLCKEDDIFNLALKHLKNKESALEFIMQLRCNSYAFRYNKVSMKADNAVRKVLLSKGYYKKKSNKNTSS